LGDDFNFISLSIGSQWENVDIRREIEAELIKLNPTLVYNQSIAGSTPKKPRDFYNKIVNYRGTTYPSIAEAHRQTGVSETRIRNFLIDPNNTDWSYAPDEQIMQESNLVNMQTAKKVIVKGTIYRSIREAARTENIDRRTLTRHLADPAETYCSYVVNEHPPED
jgi:hypothetical protein